MSTHGRAIPINNIITGKNMTDKERTIYSKLYDITSDNLQKAGGTMNSTPKEILMATLELKPDAADFSLVYDIPRDILVHALFYITFRRWPADDEIEKLDDKSLNDLKFKRETLKSVYESTERRIRKGVVSNYIDHTNEYVYSTGKFKRRVRITMTKIKAKIPLKWKMAVKGFLNKLLGRG